MIIICNPITERIKPSINIIYYNQFIPSEHLKTQEYLRSIDNSYQKDRERVRPQGDTRNMNMVPCKSME